MRGAELLEIQGARIDELRETLLRDALEIGRHRARGAGAQSRERPETFAVLELVDGRRAQRLVPIAERDGDEALGRRRIERRDRIRRRCRLCWRFAKETRQRLREGLEPHEKVPVLESPAIIPSST